MFQSDIGYKFTAVEGVAFNRFSVATQADDRHLLAKSVWDLERPSGELALGGRRASPQEIEKPYNAERVAYH